VNTTILVGDCRDRLRDLHADSVQTIITSPPYFGLRDYGMTTQIGGEEVIDHYVRSLVGIFATCRTALRDDGTLWLNLGDSFATNRSAGLSGLKHKDLIGVPWRVALALQADGWYLRSDIIWHKPNPMPESVRDRPTRAHEYLFLLSKSDRYFYDANAIAEPVAESSIKRVSQPSLEQQKGSTRQPGKSNGPMKAVIKKQDAVGNRTYTGFNQRWDHAEPLPQRNKRSVWTVGSTPFKGAHFATFPPALIIPCVLAGSRPGDTVLDPFGGAGTTAIVANNLDRNAILIELNPAYAELSRSRLEEAHPLLVNVEVA
jgi:DNA modification methylase